MTSAAISAEEKRLKGRFLVAGSSQAIAVTSATTAAPITFGRPDRFRSDSPAIPSQANRLRHFEVVFTAMSSHAAIVVLSAPSPASSTIWVRTTSRC
jgi:hypothetical protein